MGKLNAERADRADTVVKVFSALTGSDLYTQAILDLLADLRHLCDREGVDWFDVMHRAMNTHYHKEVKDDE